MHSFFFVGFVFRQWKKNKKDKHLHIVKISSSVPFQSTLVCSHLALQNILFKWLSKLGLLKKKKKSTQWWISSSFLQEMTESLPFSQINLYFCRSSLMRGEGWGSSGLDLRQLGSTDKRVGLLQKSPSGTLVVVRALMRLSVTVRGTEVVTTPEKM